MKINISVEITPMDDRFCDDECSYANHEWDYCELFGERLDIARESNVGITFVGSLPYLRVQKCIEAERNSK